MKQLFEISDFLRRMRAHVKCGELSRESLELLRLELKQGAAECEWLARPPDPWDREIGAKLSARNFSDQALLDALALRELLFRSLPDVDRVQVHAYRDGCPRELILCGTLERDQLLSAGVRSLAMRAMLLGLRFSLEDGVLQALEPALEPP